MTQPTKPTYQHWVLAALQYKPMYWGSVPPEEIAKRRAKNKVAKKSRKANRRK